jgi:hypothetical protein
LRPTIIVLALGVTTCLLAIAVWLTRPSQAATVQTLVFAATPQKSNLSAVLGSGLLRKASAEPQLDRPKSSEAKGARDGSIRTHITPSGNYILFHPDAIRADGSYDAIIHFHGIPLALEPAMKESGLHAVLLILENGILTNDYRDNFGAKGTLDRLLLAMREQVAKFSGNRDAHESKVAVSAWSAGSGAIIPMLRRSEEAARLDAVILSDSLHSSFIDLKQRLIPEEQLEPVRAFAELATEGKKLFALSHTAIQTVDYASTTETAKRLQKLLHLSPLHIVDPPAVEKKPVETSRTEKGSLVMLGFDGNDKRAHATQQWAIGRILWSKLAERWNR